jgi:hypothetical protein
MAKVKEIIGYPNYSITDKGTIISHVGLTDKILKPQRASQSKKGYFQTRLFSKEYPKGRLQYIHRLVYETFVDEIPDGYEIDHVDGNPSNNNLSNLQLVTRKENISKHYRKEYGLVLRDHRNEVIKDYETLGTLKKVAEKWSVSIQVVDRVIRNRTSYRVGNGKYKSRKYDININDKYSFN